jgi:hypothetical protein
VDAVTAKEREQYERDAAQFGDRVAYWLREEAKGWSALDQLIYWTDVRKHAVNFKDPGLWAA